MLMQRTRSNGSATSAACSGSVSGLNASPTWSSCSRASRATAAGSRTASMWNVTLSPPASAIASKWRCGSSTMRWQSSLPPSRWTSGEIDSQHDRPDRDRRDEVPVADVEVEDRARRRASGSRSARRAARSRPRRATARPPRFASSPARARSDLTVASREGLSLGRGSARHGEWNDWCRFRVYAVRISRAMKYPDVRCRCGNVSSTPTLCGCSYSGHVSASERSKASRSTWSDTAASTIFRSPPLRSCTPSR